MQGLNLAVRIGKRHLGVEFARPFDLGLQRNDDLAGANLIERHWLAIAQQFLALTAVIDSEGRTALLVKTNKKGETVITLVLWPARTQGCRHLDLGTLGRTSVEEGEPERQRHFLGRDQTPRYALHAA